MADQNKEHDLFSEDFEKRARELLDDPALRPEPAAEDNAPVKGSIDDINALLMSVGLSPIEREEDVPPAPAPEPDRELEKSRIFVPPTEAAAEPSDEAQTKIAEPAKQRTQLFTPQSGKTKVVSSPAAEPAPAPEAEADDGQMMLEGYQEEAAPRRVTEAEVEAQLKRNRKNLVENFRVLSSEQEDNAILEKQANGEGANSVFDSLEVKEGEPLFDAVDKADKKTFASLKKLGARAVQTVQQLAKSERKTVQLLDARVTKETLAQAHARVKKQTIVLGVLFALSLLLNLFGAFYTPGGAFEFLFGHGARLYSFLHLLLFAGGVLTVLRDLLDGVRALREKHWNYHATVLVLDGCVLLHTLIVLAFGMDEATGFLNFSLCALFLSLVEYAGNLVKMQTLQGDLAVMMHAGQLQGLCLLEDKADAAALGRGITDKQDPQIMVAADVPIASDYDRTAMQPTHEKLYFFGTAAAFVAAFAFALFRAIAQKNAIVFFSAFLSCAFLCAPFMRGVISTLLKTKNDATLGKEGIVVAGTNAVSQLGKADAVTVDAADLFTCTVSRFKPVPGGRMQRADAAVYAAATLRGTHSLLADAFEEFLQQTGIVAPEAEDLQYEEKLGYSCWVAGRRVLVGTREMLVQHTIDAPSAAEEAAYAGKDSVLYVAVEGIVAATFLVRYQVQPAVRRAIRAFNKSGLVLMLTCGDPSFNETLVARKLALDVAAIKIADQKSAKMIETCRANPDTQSAGLFCAKGRQGILPLLRAALGLFEGERFAGIVHIASLAFCFLLLLLCVLLKITSFFLPPTIVFLHLLWSLAAYYVGTTRLTK
jgi:cation transport ATPase